MFIDTLLPAFPFDHQVLIFQINLQFWNYLCCHQPSNWNLQTLSWVGFESWSLNASLEFIYRLWYRLFPTWQFLLCQLLSQQLLATQFEMYLRTISKRSSGKCGKLYRNIHSWQWWVLRKASSSTNFSSTSMSYEAELEIVPHYLPNILFWQIWSIILRFDHHVNLKICQVLFEFIWSITCTTKFMCTFK